MHLADFWPVRDGVGAVVDISRQPEQVQMLLYVDRKRTVPAVYRMNRGIEDALKAGVPRAYVDGVVRRIVRAQDELKHEGERRGNEERAESQAKVFKNETGVY